MTEITRLNDGWQDREDPTAPLARVLTEHGGAVIEVKGYLPPAPIPLETQHAWGRVFATRPPIYAGMYARMGLRRCLTEGLPMPGWVQEQIVKYVGEGQTPETYLAEG